MGFHLQCTVLHLAKKLTRSDKACAVCIDWCIAVIDCEKCVCVCIFVPKVEELKVFLWSTACVHQQGGGNWLGDEAGQWTDEHGQGDGETDNPTDIKADPQNRQRTKRKKEKKRTSCWTDLLMWQAVWLTLGARFIKTRCTSVVTNVECMGLF